MWANYDKHMQEMHERRQKLMAEAEISRLFRSGQPYALSLRHRLLNRLGGTLVNLGQRLQTPPRYSLNTVISE